MSFQWTRWCIVSGSTALCLLMVNAAPLVCRGDDAVEDKPYRAWRVTTELHRELVGPEINNVLAVGVDSICARGVVDPSQLDFLTVATNGTRKEKTALRLVTSRGVAADAAARRMLELALRAFLEELTLTKPAVSWTYVVGDRNEFENMVADLESDPPEGTGLEEVFVTTPTARMAPVLTPLSRFLTGDCDCYIELREPWTKLGDEALSEDLRQELKEAIDGLVLPGRNKVMLTISVKSKDGREASDRFVNQHDDAFAADLGFKFISVRINYK